MGSRWIPNRFLREFARQGSGGATSYVALKSGTLNANGVYTPTSG